MSEPITLSMLIESLQWHLQEYGEQLVGIRCCCNNKPILIGGVGAYTDEDQKPPLELITINSLPLLTQRYEEFLNNLSRAEEKAIAARIKREEVELNKLSGGQE